jgi:flagellar motor switch protein FliG
MAEAAISGERELSGPEKAAALLLMMGKPPAARLLKQFDQPDLRAVALAAAGLGAIPATTLDQLVEEFVTDYSAGADLLGDAGQAKSLLADALPAEQIADILGPGPGETGPPDVWQSLGQAPESAIVGLLMAERAATATYILSRLDPSVATRLVRALPRDRRNAALWGLSAPLN